MSHSVERIVLFVDLRGSTALYLRLGNAQATELITASLSLLRQIVEQYGGRVIKTLGDGLMANFQEAEPAIEAADQLQTSLEQHPRLVSSAATDVTVLKLKIALARGELIEVDKDCFGDAVNLAARLLDLAGDNEVLATASLVDTLPSNWRERFRSLHRLRLRGRTEPVTAYRMEGRRFSDTLATQFQESIPGVTPDGLRLISQATTTIHAGNGTPIMIGRSSEVNYYIADHRVSRLHAQIESHGGHFQLTDLSYNGTFIRFGNEEQVVILRRGTCTLHGQGLISLGTPPTDTTAVTIRFEVLSFADTVPRHNWA